MNMNVLNKIKKNVDKIKKTFKNVKNETGIKNVKTFITYMVIVR